MENSKLLMKINIFILLCCLLVSCQKGEGSNSNKTEAVEKNTIKSEPDENINLIDSTKFIVQLIENTFIDRKLKYTITEQSYNDSVYEYKFSISSLSRAELCLQKRIFFSEDKAIEELIRIEKMKEKEPMIKIVNFSFRKNNVIYGINSSENISHIRSDIFNRLLRYFDVKQADVALY